MTSTAWVVGASGLLGRAVTARLSDSAETVVAEPLDWVDDERFDQQMADALARLDAGGDWTILWCAGAGVVATGEDALATELDRLRRFLGNLERWPGLRAGGRGALFYASSAGAVYAGSTQPPFTENTDPRPLAPYGRAKLVAEGAIADLARRTGVPLLIGRITNLYGTGQRLDKQQGIISQLSRSFVAGESTSIYVPLDTVRDYIAAEDAAGIIVDGVDRARAEGGTTVKIVASHQSITLGALLGVFKAVLKRRPPTRIGSSPLAGVQARDLRVRSVVWPELDERTVSPIAVGVHRIILELLRAGTGAQSASSSPSR